MEVIENLQKYVNKQTSQNQQMTLFFTPCQLQLSISQNRPVRCVPRFVGVHLICTHERRCTGRNVQRPRNWDEVTVNLRLYALLLMENKFVNALVLLGTQSRRERTHAHKYARPKRLWTNHNCSSAR